jgi:23S rRNA (uracil1939-C5)-methyltransferase
LGRKKKRDLPFLEKVEITGVAAEGKALARVDDKVLFVPFAAPGDVVDVQVKKSKNNFMEGVVRHVHKLSDDHTEPFCSHFGLCGGCKWQHLPYEKQLAFKQQQVTDSLTRIGKVPMEEVEVLPIAASEHTRFYRNKLEFTFSNRRWLSPEEIELSEKIKALDALGFHIPGYFDKVLDIEQCQLQAEPSNAIRLAVKAFAVAEGLSFFDLRTYTGLLRNLIIRNTPAGEMMVVVVFGQGEKAAIEKVMTFIDQRFPDLTSLAWMVNTKVNSSIADLQPEIWRGKDFLEEKMEGLRFRIGPKSFFQTNSYQAHRLYSVARSFAGLTGREVVYDLYTGAGTIACLLARQTDKVIGIEYVDEAVEHARMNSQKNDISNTTFFAGDMSKVFTSQLMDKYGYPHVIITDPPRAGMHPKVIKQIISSGADRIVYVSCNPATQARDIELLSARYKVKKTQAVDMFPHTHHVENVVLLERI